MKPRKKCNNFLLPYCFINNYCTYRLDKVLFEVLWPPLVNQCFQLPSRDSGPECPDLVISTY